LRCLRHRVWLSLLVLALAVASAVAVGRASASTLSVCTKGCKYTTICAAVAAAKDGDKISIGQGTYDGDVRINKRVRLIGAGSGQTIIDGGLEIDASGDGVSNVSWHVSTAPHLLCDHLLKDVLLIDKGGGLKVSNDIVTGGSGDLGGGIYNQGTLTVKNSTITKNSANNGGGIYNDSGASLTLDSSTVSDNSATGGGGGIYDNAGTVTIKDSTVSNNTAPQGGGIEVLPILIDVASLTLKGSTVLHNDASGLGGGIYDSGAEIIAKDTVITSNAASDGGGIFNTGGTVTLKDSVLSGNTPNDCKGC
jgi:hypothetical protein